MKLKLLLTGLAVAFLFVAGTAAPAARGAAGEPATPVRPVAPGDAIGAPRLSSHVLVQLAPGAAGHAPSQRLEHLFGNWYKLAVTPGERVDNDLIDTLRRDPAFLRVEPDYLMTAHASPDDPLYPRQWHMAQVQTLETWPATTGEGVVVAVLDTGIDPAGADGFCQPLIADYNALNQTTGPGAAVDGHYHGTHVAGTIAGCANNGQGVIGVAHGAQLMAVKVLGDTGNGSNASVADGIVWAADHGARVINMSLGMSCFTTWPSCSAAILNDAIAYAAARDVVIIVSAGNDDRTVLSFPGNHPDVISVAATGYGRQRATYSNYGAALDLAAPGGQTAQDLDHDGHPDGVLQETFSNTSSGKTWSYRYLQGTSMAAPHVAGAAALLRACVPEAGRDAVRAALERYALDLGAPGFDTTYGHGFLQTRDALAGLAIAFGRDPATCAPANEPPPCFSVTAAAVGPGTLVVEPPPNCDPDGGEVAEPVAYSFGTSLTFSAEPDEGYLFAGWSGDLAGDSAGQSLRITRDLDVTATFAALPSEPAVAFSMKADGNAGGLAYFDHDVLLDEPGAPLARWVAGAAYGLGKKDIDALAVLPDGTLLISTDTVVRNLPGIGSTAVDDSDIVRFDPATGLFTWYFDGSDVGLTTVAENVDAVAALPDGRLLVSTSGKVKVPGLVLNDEDVLVFEGVLGSDQTSGTWSLYLDGSDLSAGLGDIDALAYGPGGVTGMGVLYISPEAKVTLNGQLMAPGDVFSCDIAALGEISICTQVRRVWQGVAVGLLPAANLDAVEIIWP